MPIRRPDSRHPEHEVDIAAAGTRVRVLFGGMALADSRRCLLLREGGYPPVHYFPPVLCFPRADVRMDLPTRADHHTRCPSKGKASYWSAGGEDATACSYGSPYDETPPIEG